MKWVAATVFMIAFVICLLGVFACALVGDVDDSAVARAEENNARWLLLGAVASLAGVIAILTA